MASIKVNTFVCVRDRELDDYWPTMDTAGESIVEATAPIAQRTLIRMLVDAEITPSLVAEIPADSGDQEELKDLAAGLWLKTIYRQLAQDIGGDGFSAKLMEIKSFVNEQAALTLGPPIQITLTTGVAPVSKRRVRFVQIGG